MTHLGHFVYLIWPLYHNHEFYYFIHSCITLGCSLLLSVQNHQLMTDQGWFADAEVLEASQAC